VPTCSTALAKQVCFVHLANGCPYPLGGPRGHVNPVKPADCAYDNQQPIARGAVVSKHSPIFSLQVMMLASVCQYVQVLGVEHAGAVPFFSTFLCGQGEHNWGPSVANCFICVP
jgi:hypothetical protein